nr:E-beta-farnesene synthase [Tanacetum cinerariifolium]
RKHKFNPRPDSPLHLPNEEPVLGYLKFSAKGTKREVFGMPIPDNLITSDIQVDESVDKGIPEKEARFDDDEADIQRGKGKEKVTDEQVALDLLTLQTPKKKSPADQFIFQRRTSTPTKSSGHDESSSLYAKLGLTDSEVESDEDFSGIDVGVQDEGQAKPNPGEQDEGQARPNPSDAVASQPPSSPVVHAGPNLKHTDLEATYEDLKLTVEEHVILEELAISTRTLSSLQHLAKDLSFGDLFVNDKPSEADNEKTTVETKAESMVSVIIQQDTSVIPPMTTSIWLKYAKRRKKEVIHRIPHGSPPHQPPPPPPLVGPSGTLGSPGASRSSQVLPPPPPPPSTNQDDQSHGSTAPSSSKTAASAEYKASTTTDIRIRPFVPSTPKDLHMDDDMAPDAQAHSYDNEDIRNAHIPKASALVSTYSPPLEDSLLAQTSDMEMFMDWFCKRQEITKLKPQDLEGPAFELVKVFHPNVIHLSYQMEECHKLLTDSVDNSIIRNNVSKPLTLGGPPSHIKAAYDPDVALEQMVLDQMWIEEEGKYDIAAMYGISHWWFQRQ